MGRNARIRKLRREAQKQFQAHPVQGAWARAYEQKHPDSILLSAGGGEKMSEVLEDFAQPILDGSESPQATEKALAFAIVAWNYALLDEAGKADMTRDYPWLAGDPVLRKVFEALVARKRQLYPNNKRAILDYQLIPNGTEFRFNVISTLGTEGELLTGCVKREM